MATIPHYSASIDVKPSIELLSDEYERVSDKHFVVQIIYGEPYKASADALSETMKSCGFTVNIDDFISRADFFKIINGLQTKIEKQRRAAGVFVIVLSNGHREDDKAGQIFSGDGVAIKFAEVWDGFIKMSVLNRKPKLFLFQTHTPRVSRQMETDGSNKPKRLYDLAAPGADLFLISRSIEIKLVSEPQDRFIERFCNIIEEHGKYVDIFEIATFAADSSSSVRPVRPLVVSTLTAKFFFKKDEHRHYNYLILKDLKEIQESLVEQETKQA